MSRPAPLAPAAPRLAARGLGCVYRRRETPSLRDVDLELVPGEVTLLAGRSGSGKTSLLRCLDGLVPRAYPGSRRTGELTIDGADPSRWSLARIGRRVGTLLQDPARQIVGLDVFRELAFGPENRGLPVAEVERRARAAAERLGIAELLARSTAELSGGQLQKVALAGVLAVGAEVLLFDEPLAALDPESASEVARLVRELADRGCAVLVVEHRVEAMLEARPDRAVLLENGCVEYSGDVAGFLERAHPAHQHLPFDAAVRRWRELDAGAAPDAPPAHGAAPRRSAPGAEVLRCEGLHHRYEGGVRTLRGVDLALGAGEVVALVGANGAGKSTLLQHAAGLLRPERGVVWIGGRDARELTLAQLSREVGYLFSDPGAMLFADTVEEECLFAPRNQGLGAAAARERAGEALRRLGLLELKDEPPRALSLGQQKRVGLAAVASQGARVWVLDEPTAGLDPGGVTDFLAALREGSRRDDAVLFATHDLDLALLFADRVAVVEDGRLAALGPPGEVLFDEALLARARLRTTSLLEANRGRVAHGLAPLHPRELARRGHARGDGAGDENGNGDGNGSDAS